MIENFFKIAYRNLWRNKAFSAINILGLSIGMASAMVIFMWIQNEASHDTFHEKKDRLYIANNRDKFNNELWAWSQTSKPLAPALKQDYPEVEDASRVLNREFLLKVGEKRLYTQGIFADSGFLKMFSFPVSNGSTKYPLGENNNIVITQKLAKKLFGDEDALGKIIKIDSVDNFTVSAVLNNLPNNTRFSFEYILPWQYLTKIGGDDTYWGNNSVKTYILLKPGVSQASFDAKIKNITIDHTKDGEKSTTVVFTQPLAKAWLYSRPVNGQYVTGRIEQVKLFAIIAVFILLIACINFMNLSTARSEKRAREVGIRKVVGAQKSSLVLQFIGESILIALLAAIIAIVIVQLSLPAFNLLTSKTLLIDYTSPGNWFFVLAFVLFTGLLAGSYPAFYLSSYQPIKVLKGTFKAAHALVTPRKVLVVLQFTFAIALIICTIIIQHQINFAQARETGYSRNNLLYVDLQGDVEKNYPLIKNELLNKGAAVAINKSMSPITERYSDAWGYSWPGSLPGDERLDFIRMSTDADFVKTMGLTLLQGRDIDIKNYPTDSTAMLLNEAAVKVMRLKNPVGQIVKSEGTDWHIVGVVKDFIYESPYEKIAQLVVMGPKSWFSVMHIKLNAAKPMVANIAILEQVFRQYNPQYPFVYKFIDEEYAIKFEDEKRTGKLAGLFAGLTIFISCLGLFGLATYMAENRIKEIGIRKVLGASIAGITRLLSLDFLKLVLISFLIASPIAWFAMSKWLQGYTYRVNIEWWVFAMAGILSIVVALFTISFQAIKAAIANPVKSLRTE